MSEKTKYRKYDHSAALSRQVDRVNQTISTGLQDLETTDFDLYFSNIVMSLMALDGMLQPFKDDEYPEIFKDKKFATMKRDKKMGFVRDAMRQITQLMYRRNLFYASHTEKQIGGKDKE